jgi:tripartite ATP-independent transporter DctM subunit
MMSVPITAFLFFMILGLPVALVMVVTGLTGAVSIGGLEFLEILADRLYAGVSGFVLIAIPYFILTAELMNRANLTDRLIAFANSLFGRIPGALSHVNVAVSVLFAGITGAAVTDTVAIGKTLIPSMKKEGYHADYCAAVTACSSIIGPIIPPSIIMVVYAATLRGLSMVDLFIAGIIPGFLMGAALLITSGWICWRRGYVGKERISIKRIVSTGSAAFAAMIVPVVILGGILSGIATVTEAAAIGAAYTLIIGVFVYRTLGWKEIWAALETTINFSGVVFFLLGASTILGWYITRSGIARDAAEVISAISTVPSVQLFAVCSLLLILGAFVDVLPAVVIAGPVLAPAMIQLGFDPLHFGMIMLLALNIGNITPPVGMTLLVAAKLAEVPYEKAVRASMPFLITHLVVLALVALIPELTTWLPQLFG